MNEADTPDDRPTPDSLELLARGLIQQQTNHIAERARLDALESLLLALCEKVGWPRQATLELLRTQQATFHQARLESLERIDPSIAAMADNRASLEAVDWSLLDELSDADDGGDGSSQT